MNDITIKSLQELDEETGIGLIEKRRQGFGKVNVIYVKTFMVEKTEDLQPEEEEEKFTKQTSEENEPSTEVYNSNFKKFTNQTSRSPENKLQEVYISNSNNTKYNNTNINNTESNLILSINQDLPEENMDYDGMGCDEIEIRNIKKYLLAALYNAPVTMQGYYQAEVNHTIPQYAGLEA